MSVLAYLCPYSLLLCGCKRPEETPKADTKFIYSVPSAGHWSAWKFFLQIMYCTLSFWCGRLGLCSERHTIYYHLQNSTQCVYTTYNTLSGQCVTILHLANCWWNCMKSHSYIFLQFSFPSQWRFGLGVGLMVDPHAYPFSKNHIIPYKTHCTNSYEILVS